MKYSWSILLWDIGLIFSSGFGALAYLVHADMHFAHMQDTLFIVIGRLTAEIGQKKAKHCLELF